MNQVEVYILRKKIYTFKITAKNIILSVLTSINKIYKSNQSNLLQFAV